MDFDPHTLHQIIQRIQQQMRCPQCGEKVPVDFGSVKLTGDDFILLQLKCHACDAYVVLHASLQEAAKDMVKKEEEKPDGVNASSVLCMKEKDVEAVRISLKKVGGSFNSLFEGAEAEVEAETE